MRLLNTREAADLLGIQPDTLKLWRHQGKGPKFVKKGESPQASVGYESYDVEAWKAERKFESTSAVTVRAGSTRKYGTCASLPASA
jgi:predicted DNA-binding transcriptional regulator AlpA